MHSRRRLDCTTEKKLWIASKGLGERNAGFCGEGQTASDWSISYHVDLHKAGSRARLNGITTFVHAVCVIFHFPSNL